MVSTQAPTRPAARRDGPSRTVRLRVRQPQLDLWFEGDDLRSLRAAITTYVRRMDGGERGEDVLLVAHELATNAVRHGGGSGRLRLRREHDRFVCQVTDFGPGLACSGVEGFEPPCPQVIGGRGLWIARRLSTLHIETGPAGSTVTAELTV